MARLDSEQDAYEDVTQEQRREAVRRIVELNIEDPPDPATLSRELASPKLTLVELSLRCIQEGRMADKSWHAGMKGG